MPHDHQVKITKFGLNDKFVYTALEYQCDVCKETFDTLPKTEEVPSEHQNHYEYVDGCFGCKVKTLELNTGDAGKADGMPQKKWDAELQAYRDARAQGIQPAGTTMKKINEAKEASDKLGAPFDAGAMPDAKKITTQTAKVMKEVGAI